MLFVPLLGELLSSLARLEPISGKRMILETEPDEASKFAFFDIQNTNRVVLLKRHPRGFRVMRNRTVFRLEVLRQGRVGSIFADGGSVGFRYGVVKSRISHIGLGEIRRSHRHIDDADEPFGIDRRGLIIAIRFTLVGYQHVFTVRRKRNHVRQRARRNRAQ